MNKGIQEFRTLSDFDNCVKMGIPASECGLYFRGENVIDDKTSVLTNEMIPLRSPKAAKNTYKKVVEVRKLSLAEEKAANRARGIFKIVFDRVFDNSYSDLTLFCSEVALFLTQVWCKNFLATLFSIVVLTFTYPPKEIWQGIKKSVIERVKIEIRKERFTDKEYRKRLHNPKILGLARNNSIDFGLYVREK